ncbi:MAG TPA: hypothetical protein DCR20_15475 [Planctomycetaceae bacterium]|jgi:hypothetical protein|nr:hypothetical protein [Planctomycetaceae bacterium]
MSKSPASRRRFVTTALAASATLAVPATSHAARRFGNETIIGEGEYKYRAVHNFAQLPDKYSWQTTHNVALDSSGNLYVIHEGRRDLKDHPSIFVFDPAGKFVRAFGAQFQGGGHGVEIRKEGNQEFLYVAAYQQVKAFAKMTLNGEIVWFKKAPMESGLYAEGENTSTEPSWNRKGFLPTNFAFLDDGGFLLADGYGTFAIHRFDRDGNWKSSFGGAGEGAGTFNTAHGLWVDNRAGKEPTIVVTDRAHNTLQIFSMDGKYLETIAGFGLPANVETQGNLMLVPELKACVTLLNEKNEVVARLGRAVERLDEVKDLRGKPDQWKDGQFVHPHDACFAPNGDLFVAEWVATGRITKLVKV